MKRRIITIDSEKCNGCGLCVDACHEGAIGLIEGKAVLLRDDYCDGLGDCLPSCPVNAISFEEREAAAFDVEAVKVHMAARAAAKVVAESPSPCGCPGSHSKTISRKAEQPAESVPAAAPQSMLRQWPVQIQLVPVNASYLKDANLLIAADCTAFAYGNFHNDFIKNHVTLIGCPKLDDANYAYKLTDILTHNNIKSLKIVRMEVPCCGGIEFAAKQALQSCGKLIPWQVMTVGVDGSILAD